MRLGMEPKLAAKDAISRIAKKYLNFVGALFAVNKNGTHAGACYGWMFQYSVRSPGMDDVEVVTVAQWGFKSNTKQDKDFCLVADNNLHINGHFIGKRNDNMGRDFTWVQYIGVRFANQKLQIDAQKTASWDDAIDRISITYDGESILLPETEDAKNGNLPQPQLLGLGIQMMSLLKLITSSRSRPKWSQRFKLFYSLSNEVDGVLGQTYKSDYVSNVKKEVLMPVMGGEKMFKSGNLFATDCSMAKFTGNHEHGSSLNLELPSSTTRKSI
ncbi:putative root cap [Tanacetum coccineum]